jgi:hypothetical protein
MASASHNLLFRVGIQQNCENTHHETPDTKPHCETPDTKPHRETPDTKPHREKPNKGTMLIYREKYGLTSDTLTG